VVVSATAAVIALALLRWVPTAYALLPLPLSRAKWPRKPLLSELQVPDWQELTSKGRKGPGGVAKAGQKMLEITKARRQFGL
jgi:hypothetical protein